MDFDGVVFSDCKVELDGHVFRGCTFENVTLHYDGGSISLDECLFRGSLGWELGGHLGNGIEALRKIAHIRGPKGVKAMADALANLIRRRDAPTTFRLR